MPYATLTGRGLIVLQGPDTLPFLQGLVSNDVLRLPERGIVYTALLTPQGKFLHDFFVMAHGQSVLIDGEAARLADLVQRLLRYRLRSQVTIEPMQDVAVGVVWQERCADLPAENGVSVFNDPRLEAMGLRIVGEHRLLTQWAGKQHLAQAEAADYERWRIECGVPQGGSDLIAEKSFILPFGFEALHGVDFNKGCYVGQEVTARSKHLGTLRKFIYKVQSTQDALPATGTPVMRGEIAAGELRSVQGAIGLALLSVEEVEKARLNGTDLLAGPCAIKVALPAWATKKLAGQ